MAGESRPSRTVVTLFPDHASRPDPDDIPPPKWLSAAAKRLWATKVNRYRQRGQKVAGFEDSLAQYCSLEAELIDFYRKKTTPPMAMAGRPSAAHCSSALRPIGSRSGWLGVG